MAEVPMPGECHPAYVDRPYLRDWLNGETGYPRDHLVIPIFRSTFASLDASPEPITELPRTMILTRKKCAGGAPYVGRPFCYTWDAAVDDVGRWIAGDARLQYTTDEWSWRHDETPPPRPEG